MELKMKLNGILIDAVKISSAHCRDENYLKALKEDLRQKHHRLIVSLQKQPIFFLFVGSNE